MNISQPKLRSENFDDDDADADAADDNDDDDDDDNNNNNNNNKTVLHTSKSWEIQGSWCDVWHHNV